MALERACGGCCPCVADEVAFQTNAQDQVYISEHHSFDTVSPPAGAFVSKGKFDRDDNRDEGQVYTTGEVFTTREPEGLPVEAPRGKDVMPLNEDEVVSRAWWCLYCCCGGCGCSSQQAYPGAICKCMYCHQICETVECGGPQGLLSSVQVCCCCVTQMQIPPRGGHAPCILCSCVECGKTARSTAKEKHEIRTSTEVEQLYVANLEERLFDTFILSYCCCAGCGVTGELLDCYSALQKCLCWRCTCRPGTPSDSNGCCLHLWTCGPCYSHCRVPPKYESSAPLYACCGRKHAKIRETNNVGVAEKPRQQDMS